MFALWNFDENVTDKPRGVHATATLIGFCRRQAFEQHRVLFTYRDPPFTKEVSI
jgi:hypothetical protein